jgi:hypothetical protein
VEGFEVGMPSLPRMAFPLEGDTKREYGARLFAEWHGATLIAQATVQDIAGLERQGWEVEGGWHIPVSWGFVESIQPALRASGINIGFDALPSFPAPSFWWDWMKFDGGLRIGLTRGFDVTLESTYHIVESRRSINPREAMLTVRYRM